MSARLRIGFIPLVDAAALIMAVECGFTVAEGLDVTLVREVSWSNVRDKLNIGLFDAAHMLSPMMIASSLGTGHVRVPLVAPFNLGLNGNAITVSEPLYAAMLARADGDIGDPAVSARALARIVAERRAAGEEQLAFGITFPFSNHNYQLRLWMSVGGIDPDEDVRLVVLPPPYMVRSLQGGQINGFCVGAPWNSIAVEQGIGRILHFGCSIVARASEKVLAVHEAWADQNRDVLDALLRALHRAAAFIESAESRAAVARAVAGWLDVEHTLVARTLAGDLQVAADGSTRSSDRYLMVGRGGASRPDPTQAAWIYAQMVRWHQAPLSDALLARARAVFRSDLYDAALGAVLDPSSGSPPDGIGCFAGPPFDPGDLRGHLAAWSSRPAARPRLSVVR
jgi:NitT/TauT family transport system ATP-binding protein